MIFYIFVPINISYKKTKTIIQLGLLTITSLNQGHDLADLCKSDAGYPGSGVTHWTTQLSSAQMNKLNQTVDSHPLQ